MRKSLLCIRKYAGQWRDCYSAGDGECQRCSYIPQQDAQEHQQARLRILIDAYLEREPQDSWEETYAQCLSQLGNRACRLAPLHQRHQIQKHSLALTQEPSVAQTIQHPPGVQECFQLLKKLVSYDSSEFREAKAPVATSRP